MRLKWRALKTRSKIMLAVSLGIGLITVLALTTLIAQHTLGRYYFAQECKANDGEWSRSESERAKPKTSSFTRTYRQGGGTSIHDDKSKAYDIQGVTGGSDHKGCGGSYARCIIGLTSLHGGPYDFVEIFVHEPAAEFLSSETGWYRYWLAPENDAACAAFHASEEAQEHWRAWLSTIDHPNRPPGFISILRTKCIASEKIEKPESRYVHQGRHHIDKRIFGLQIHREDHVNPDNREVFFRTQSTEYLGSWLNRAYTWIKGEKLKSETCPIPEDGGYDHDDAYITLPAPKEPVYAPIYDGL